MIDNRLYKKLGHALATTSQAWYCKHQALLVADKDQQNKLVFEERQLEQHMQRLVDTYNQLLRRMALQKKQRQAYNDAPIND